ncbi:MAG: hypothetical protein ABEK10_02730 [Candidatus Nanosalina sp.]
MTGEEFDYLDDPEAYRTAMAELYGGDPESFSERDYRELDEDERSRVDGMVEMNDIIGHQAGGLAGMEDLNDTEEYLEGASDD